MIWNILPSSTRAGKKEESPTVWFKGNIEAWPASFFFISLKFRIACQWANVEIVVKVDDAVVFGDRLMILGEDPQAPQLTA